MLPRRTTIGWMDSGRGGGTGLAPLRARASGLLKVLSWVIELAVTPWGRRLYDGSRAVYDEVVWDGANEEHATRHGVSIVEIAQVFANGPLVTPNRLGRSAQYVAEGETDGGRVVVVAFDRIGEHAVRPVAAWATRRKR